MISYLQELFEIIKFHIFIRSNTNIINANIKPIHNIDSSPKPVYEFASISQFDIELIITSFLGSVPDRYIIKSIFYFQSSMITIKTNISLDLTFIYCKLLINTLDYFALQQQIDYKLILDSNKIADLIYSEYIKTKTKLLFVLSIDMFSRLNNHEQLVNCFLEEGMIIKAFEISLQRKTLALDNVLMYLDISLENKDLQIFLTIYNILFLNKFIDIENSRFTRYVTKYSKLTDGLFEMEYI